MAEVKKLLHADIGAESYSYEIEETAEHLTVAHLTRDAAGGWKYEVTARRIDAAPAADARSADVSGQAGGYATPGDAIAAARAHARNLLAAPD
jgi:hypothetical protein